ncbi:hypothetical protein [Pseudothauera hydrothermalis]
MRVLVKRILCKYSNPADLRDSALQPVLQQAGAVPWTPLTGTVT